jgi:hypothetical protein
MSTEPAIAFLFPSVTCDGCQAEHPVCAVSGTTGLAFDLETERLLCASCAKGKVSRKLASGIPSPNINSDPYVLQQRAIRRDEQAKALSRHYQLLASDPEYAIWLKQKGVTL